MSTPCSSVASNASLSHVVGRRCQGPRTKFFFGFKQVITRSVGGFDNVVTFVDFFRHPWAVLRRGAFMNCQKPAAPARRHHRQSAFLWWQCGKYRQAFLGEDEQMTGNQRDARLK